MIFIESIVLIICQQNAGKLLALYCHVRTITKYGEKVNSILIHKYNVDITLAFNYCW
jgi:hypothetical protein